MNFTSFKSSPAILELSGLRRFKLIGLDSERIEDYVSFISPTYNRMKRVWQPFIMSSAKTGENLENISSSLGGLIHSATIPPPSVRMLSAFA